MVDSGIPSRDKVLRGTYAVAGGEHTLLRTSEGNIWSAGACGLGWSRLLPVAPELFAWRRARMPEPVADVFPGYYHNLAIGARSQSLYSWGCGTFPEGRCEGSKPALGQGADAEDSGGAATRVEGIQEQVTSAAAGAYHSAALTKSGRVLTFGAAQLGQLGRRADASGTTDASGLPVDPQPAPVEGLPERSQDRVTKIAAGFYNTFAMCRSGALFCAGENQNAQCGFQSGARNLFRMVRVRSGLEKEKIAAASGGYCHTLALTRDGRVLTLGCGEDGQRGDNREPEDPDRPVVTEAKLPVNADGATRPRVVQVAAGANHSVVLSEDGRVFAFGSNEYGQCGPPRESGGASLPQNDDDDDDDEEEELLVPPIIAPREVTLPSGTGPIASVSAGYTHTVLTSVAGKVLMFGQNSNGQLGMGSASAVEANDVPCPQSVTLP